MIKFRYLFLSIAACAMISLTSCTSDIPKAEMQTQSTVPVAEISAHGGHGNKAKININNAILSQLDKLEATLGVPALSNKIQANRPYASPGDLVSKKVITQPQFDQIKDMVTVEEVVLTGEAKDIDYMTKLGLMKGHLLVAKELLDQNQPKQAQPHIGHPVEEIYIDVEEQLEERKVKEFKSNLVSLTDLVKSNPKDAKIKTNFTTSVQAVDSAIAALPTEERRKPKFVLQVINGLLDAANSEYGAAIANGKITAPIEYQDSRGFIVYSQELYKGISSQMTQEHPESHKAIDTAFMELVKVWPTAIPPVQAVSTPEDVTKLVKIIEENTQKVRTKTSTKAQN
ncbi:MAG: helix-hairpin-helix domain-containing protein [Aphanizomenon flos-aquae KM1D3_PB]|uniref:ComEA family DNA-binding protein n=1 Tax=Aphanizomenon flos-aquae TaxID=1176 RepID=UPI0005438592|nr:helix-hairpin-helix domain-containing protein [Aphanizomenon flos-aquae]KHG41834.1 DNA uptake protein [Aphanizomenon flos-aquae 2012/KM1/D3]QSV69974.1 MAG: helix-hairpin-helix domain-containing protein [Aphanizomenon flos-aquae KM1D3_PB]